jgi:hypothetical protein
MIRTLPIQEPQIGGDTNCTNFHEFVLIRVIRVFRKLALSVTCFEIQGLWCGTGLADCVSGLLRALLAPRR